MKVRFYLAMAAAALLMSNCSQEEGLNQVQGSTKTLTATIEGASRSAVTDGGVFSWTTGDAISVWVGNSYDTYAFDDATTNSFNAPEDAGTPTGYAIYPANDNHGDGNLSNGGLPSVMMPASYVGEGSTNAPMLAKIEGSSLSFKHLGGLMRFVVKNVPNSTTSFTFTANKTITGDFSIETENGENVIKAGSESTTNNTVTIEYEIGSVQDQMVFYIPLPVGTYEGYTVSIGDKSHTTENTVTNTIARGTLLLMPVFTYTDNGLEKDGSGSYVALEGGEQSLATGNGKVLIDTSTLPAESDVTATLNLNYTPSETESNLTISDGSAEGTASTDSKATVNVRVEGDEEVETLNINAPTLTVNLASGTYGTVTAKTATETLIVGNGVTIGALTVNGGNIKLDGDATINSLVVPEGSEITLDLNGKTLTLQDGDYGITNKGTLAIKGGTISSTNTAGAVLNYNANSTNTGAAHLTLTDVVVEASEIAVICWSRDYTSTPNDATQPVTTLTINGGEFTSTNSYAVKSWGFCRMTFDKATFAGAGGVSCESSYLTMTDCTCEATGNWYDLHVYCGEVTHTGCTFKSESNNLYIQIYDETNNAYSYGSKVNGTGYGTSDVVSGNGVFPTIVSDGTKLKEAVEAGQAVMLANEVTVEGGITIESDKAAFIDLSGKTLRMSENVTQNVQSVGDVSANIINKGKLTMRNGVLCCVNGSAAILNYNGQARFDYVAGERSSGSIIISVSTDWKSVPGQATEMPTTTLTLEACNFTTSSQDAYVIKVLGYNDVDLTKSNIAGQSGGVSCESSYLDITGGECKAHEKYYGLHIYCSVANLTSPVITGADAAKDIYVQIYDENNSSYSYDSKIGETTYTTANVESGNKGLFIDWENN